MIKKDKWKRIGAKNAILSGENDRIKTCIEEKRGNGQNEKYLLNRFYGKREDNIREGIS